MPAVDRTLHSANVLISVAGTATADAILPGMGTAVGGLMSLQELTRSLFGKTPDLNRQIANRLHEQLNRTHLSDGVRTLIPQMIENGVPNSEAIVACGRNGPAIAGAMLDALPDDPAYRTDPARDGFSKVVAPILDELLKAPDPTGELEAAFQSFVARGIVQLKQLGKTTQSNTEEIRERQMHTAAELSSVKSNTSDISKRFDEFAVKSMDLMEKLAFKLDVDGFEKENRSNTKSRSPVSAELPLRKRVAMKVGDVYVREKISDWFIRCIRAEIPNRETCQIYQLLRNQDGSGIAEISLVPMENDQRVAAIANVMTPLGTLLTPGLNLGVDDGQVLNYPFTVCSNQGCLARFGVTSELLEQLEYGKNAKITITAAQAPDRPILLDVSLDGFARSFDSLLK